MLLYKRITNAFKSPVLHIQNQGKHGFTVNNVPKLKQWVLLKVNFGTHFDYYFVKYLTTKYFAFLYKEIIDLVMKSKIGGK